MKPIRNHYSLKTAEKVRRAINRLNTSTKLVQNASFECFDNCREQGYVLSIFGIGLKGIHIAFAQQRNSDEIVTYVYENVAFPSNLPQDETDWLANRKFFRYDEVDKAAQYILDVATVFVDASK